VSWGNLLPHSIEDGRIVSINGKEIK